MIIEDLAPMSVLVACKQRRTLRHHFDVSCFLPPFIFQLTHKLEDKSAALRNGKRHSSSFRDDVHDDMHESLHAPADSREGATEREHQLMQALQRARDDLMDVRRVCARVRACVCVFVVCVCVCVCVCICGFRFVV